MNYRDLQNALREYKEAGRTNIRLNSSELELRAELGRLQQADIEVQAMAMETGDEPLNQQAGDELDLSSIAEISADLIAACDDLNFHNLDALDRDERNPLIEALSYLRNAADQIQSIAARTYPKRTVYRVKYDRPHLIPVRRLGRVMDALLSRPQRCFA